MKSEEFRFPSDADGLSLQAYAWSPEGEPARVVQISHGLAEHSRRYARFADQLTGAGFAVYAHDHRGHGGSLIAPDQLGDPGDAGWNGLVADLAQMNALIRERHPGAKHFLFAHSMGSFAAQHALPDLCGKIDGCVLSGSTDLAAVAEMVAATGVVPTLQSYNAAFEPARTPFDWLSRDEAEVDAYVGDPLCGFEAPDALTFGLMGAAATLGDPAHLAAIRNDLPLLVMAGEADPLNGGLMLLKSLIEKYRAAGLKNVDEKFYPGGRHEMLNETNRDEVTVDIIDWLKRAA